MWGIGALQVSFNRIALPSFTIASGIRQEVAMTTKVRQLFNDPWHGWETVWKLRAKGNAARARRSLPLPVATHNQWLRDLYAKFMNPVTHGRQRIRPDGFNPFWFGLEFSWIKVRCSRRLWAPKNSMHIEVVVEPRIGRFRPNSGRFLNEWPSPP